MTVTTERQLIKIGYVGKPHGLRGAFYVAGRSEAIPPEIKKVYVGMDEAMVRPLTVKTRRMQADRPVLWCEELMNREALAPLMGQTLWLVRGDLSVDEANEYCWADLPGKSIVDSQGVPMGAVEAIENYGASDVLSIRGSDTRLLLVPFVASYFDMSFTHRDTQIRMMVPSDTFADAWQ